ncbi:ATP-dependent DNA helicase pif1 [Elysia marginata]|uniref:ATP-dependent DNA helicase pif1 n=1 Tax=Elysia marginata TaxID=1093978 RepID=A0AAV4IJS8_9GAST|nr:ATP-dependent DNA helicase pif1 [Elysia marginata]
MAPVILLTRCMIIIIIDARVACGPHAGKRIVIPQIPLKQSDNVFPFQMTRKQFPIRPSFAITANKPQGQTLKKIGISINQDFFSHVALSRVGSRQSVKIYSSTCPNPGVTNNVVYKEILQQELQVEILAVYTT